MNRKKITLKQACIFYFTSSARKGVNLPLIVGDIKSHFPTFDMFLLAGLCVPLLKHSYTRKSRFLLLWSQMVQDEGWSIVQFYNVKGLGFFYFLQVTEQGIYATFQLASSANSCKVFHPMFWRIRSHKECTQDCRNNSGLCFSKQVQFTVSPLCSHLHVSLSSVFPYFAFVTLLHSVWQTSSAPRLGISSANKCWCPLWWVNC